MAEISHSGGAYSMVHWIGLTSLALCSELTYIVNEEKVRPIRWTTLYVENSENDGKYIHF